MQSINLGYFRNIYANAKFEEEFYISIKLDSVDYNGPTIKMISKPSKKKQSANSVCILSGSNIALFNRLRSQTVTTKYLLIDNEELVVDAIDWNQFKIWKIDRELYDAAESSSFIWKNETELNFVRVTGQEILYEDAIVLEHVESGVFLAPFIVQSFNKCIKEGDLVSPLHKVGLKTKDGYMYLFEETNVHINILFIC